MKQINDTSMAITLFIDAAVKHSKATEEGDYKTGNKCYNIIVEAANFLKSKNSLDKLESLTGDASIGVRLWAAAYLLPLNEKKAIETLKAIINSGGIHAMTAEVTLNEWKNGNLKL